MNMKLPLKLVCGEYITVIDCYGYVFRGRIPNIEHAIMNFYHTNISKPANVKVCYVFSHWKNKICWKGPSHLKFYKEVKETLELGHYTPEFAPGASCDVIIL